MYYNEFSFIFFNKIEVDIISYDAKTGIQLKWDQNFAIEDKNTGDEVKV